MALCLDGTLLCVWDCYYYYSHDHLIITCLYAKYKEILTDLLLSPCSVARSCFPQSKQRDRRPQLMVRVTCVCYCTKVKPHGYYHKPHVSPPLLSAVLMMSQP